jgi:hypothetical protein
MSGFMNALKKFFTKDRMIIIIIAVVLAMFVLYYSSGKMTMMDNMEDGAAKEEKEEKEEMQPSLAEAVPGVSGVSEAFTAANYSAKEVANPSELLPKDDNSQWSSLNPSVQHAPNTPDLLQAGIHVGLDTVGQTMKNANLQLRSDPVIPKSDIGPWNQSTVEPDLIRLPLEVSSTYAK